MKVSEYFKWETESDIIEHWKDTFGHIFIADTGPVFFIQLSDTRPGATIYYLLYIKGKNFWYETNNKRDTFFMTAPESDGEIEYSKIINIFKPYNIDTTSLLFHHSELFRNLAKDLTLTAE